ncbi:MAG: RES family NAD+ phosphorylase [Candidatus Rokubacteria bacterium]|nr:RES family NAD+ phosphorylase [Candidatus Rokubacteria bacterium]
MIRVWRISKAKNAAFDGEGARLSGGRWNHPGTAVVYTSSTLALAVLELFVHLDPSEAPDDLVAIPADIPASLPITRIRPAQLPTNWRRYPAPAALADLGTRWARGRKTAVLAVPSAVIPLDLNYLLNPLHPAFKQIRVGEKTPFQFDPRMFKR